MALKKGNAAASAEAQTPAASKFEEPDDNASTAPSAASSDEASPAASTDSAPAATVDTPTTTALAAAPATSVATVGKKFSACLEEFRNVIDPAAVEFNTFTRVTVGLDGFEDDQKKDLGKRLVMKIISFNDRYVASPGTQDAEATPLVRYSLDGKTIEGTGESVADYVKMLKEVEGYADACIKQYLTIYGMLQEANGKPIPAEDQTIIALQVPPQSRARFSRLQIEAGLKVGMGAMKATDILVCDQEKQQGKDRKYAIISFSMAKA